VSTDDRFDWRPILEQTGFIAEMPHSVAFLLPDQTYRGRTVVWLKEHFGDPADLPTGLRVSLMNEVMFVAEALRRVLRPDRLNYTCFGNAVPHVHWHIIPRFKDDPDWGKAPWRESERSLAPADVTALTARIAKKLETVMTED
jgi:diadenosine tetraphosphate (Ap4A) HIT family hydrolase